MSWGKYRLSTAVGLAMALGASCGDDPHPNVSLGTFAFTGSMDMRINNCTVANPTVDWTTRYTASASQDIDHIWIDEEAYGCSFIAPLKGSVADAGGLSCPVSVAGFFRQDFVYFRWDFAKKELNFASVLYGQDANNAVIKYCASVRGSITN